MFPELAEAPDETEMALSQIEQWKLDPVLFVRECFGVEPDPWQAKVLRLSVTERRISMQACVGPGKTCVLAWIVWNFLLNEYAQIGALSSSGANVRNGLWKELAYWRDKSPMLKSTYVMTATRIFVPSITDGPEEDRKDYERSWFCELRTWSKDADENMAGITLQGLHSIYVMIVMDESGGMPESLLVAAEGILATKFIRGHIIQAGNPTHLSGPLYFASKHPTMWKVIAVTGDPDDPDCSPRTNKDWAREMLKIYGRDHPYVMVKVLGLFPPSSFNALIGPDEANKAIGRHLAKSQYDKAARILGVDVARYGDDMTVVWPRQGLAAFEPEPFRNAHPDDIAGYIALLMQTWDGGNVTDAVMVDATGGFGDGVCDSLQRIGITAIRVQFASKPIKPKFYNKRSEIIWNLVDWIRSGGAVPDSAAGRMMIEELCEITYTFRLDKILMEEKEMVKDRLGRSPDYSDALACSFAFPVVPMQRDILEGIDTRGRGSGSYNKAITDYDPLSRD
jgi:phage terminase large subunit